MRAVEFMQQPAQKPTKPPLRVLPDDEQARSLAALMNWKKLVVKALIQKKQRETAAYHVSPKDIENAKDELGIRKKRSLKYLRVGI